jgi:NAD(P)-dependent dehydrogenase (short-subunit alcohol dehydrogenase family)
LDVTAPEDTPGSPANAVDTIADWYGRLDVLVNKAGATVEVPAPVMTADDLRSVFAVNVFGVAETIRVSLPLLRNSKAPRIVNVSSTTASLSLTAAGRDFGGDAGARAAYAASKSALNMLTLQYHQAFAADDSLRHIRINAATPGYVATRMSHGRGVRTVEEGARVIVSLALAGDDCPSGGFFNDAGPVAW